MSLTREELLKLRAEIDELLAKKTPENKRWVPDVGDKYAYISGDGAIYYVTHCDTIWDNDCIIMHNAFNPNTTDAQDALEAIKVFNKLMDAADWYGCSPNDDTHTHYLYYDFAVRAPMISSFRINYTCTPVFWFEDREKGIEAIESIGKEKIMKYYFRIKH